MSRGPALCQAQRLPLSDLPSHLMIGAGLGCYLPHAGEKVRPGEWTWSGLTGRWTLLPSGSPWGTDGTCPEVPHHTLPVLPNPGWECPLSPTPKVVRFIFRGVGKGRFLNPISPGGIILSGGNGRTSSLYSSSWERWWNGGLLLNVARAVLSDTCICLS